MKMKISGFLAFTLLSISILSFGLTGAVNAQSDGLTLPLSVSTELSSYADGDIIVISGSIKTLAEYAQDVIVRIYSPDPATLVFVDQVSPDINGDYSTTSTAGGAMKLSGNYEIHVQYGAQKITNTFVYTAGNSVSEPIVTTTPEPTPEPEPTPINCGPGTEDVNGICQVIQTENKSEENGGGCLIATATYGSELSPQVQLLREIRDNQLLNTEAGTSFMNTFNDVYYSFSPVIADMERESPMFKEVVKLGLTPMLSSLAIMENANSESEVISLGLSVIALNLGMYLAIPAIVIIGIKSRK